MQTVRNPTPPPPRSQMVMTMRYAQLVGLLLLCGLLLALAPAVRAQTATSTVTSLTDEASTPGSLRYLLNQANATSTPTAIIFNSALSGGTLTPASPLPLAANIRLLAQDAAGMAVDMTLDGSQLPTDSGRPLAERSVLHISSPTATVSGFDIVNFAGAGIAVASSPNCPLTARVTLSDNVLVASSTATSTPHAIEVTSVTNQCTAVTIRANNISQTPGSRATGISIRSTDAGTSHTMASSSVDALVADNTITTAVGISIGRSTTTGDNSSRVTARLSANRITGTREGIAFVSTIGSGGSNRLVAQLSANRITGPQDGIAVLGSVGRGAVDSATVTLSGNHLTGTQKGIRIASTSFGSGTSLSTDATLSGNYITGARKGLEIDLSGNGTSNSATVNGTGNVVLGSSDTDISASENRYQINGRLERTIFNTIRLAVGTRANSFTVHRYQVDRLPPGGITGGHQNQDGTTEIVTVTTIEETYLADPAQFTPREAVERAVSVVSGQATSTDFGTMPVVAGLLPQTADGRVATRGLLHPVRVCLPVPADLSASAPRIAWRDGTVWRTLPSARSGDEICAELSFQRLLITYIVTTLTDEANTLGSLPYLLNQANATSTPTEILFDPTLSGGTITPTSPLPLAGNTQLRAQDVAGRSVDMTLDGSQLPADGSVLRISSPTATVRGFDIVNFAGAGIAVAASPNCPVTARVTLSDNVLVASSTARAIELDSGPGCAGVTIRENDISQTPGSHATGVYLHKTLSSTATSSVDLIVADNTITTSATGVYLRTSLSDTATSTLATTLSANRITGAGTGIDITSTTSSGNSSQVAATLSRNYITGANFGIQMRLDGSGGSNTVTVDGSWNTVIGSSTLDLYVSEYGVNGSQAGRSGFDVSGRLENTLFNTRNIIPGEAHTPFTRQAYRAAQRQRPPAAWALYHWPASFTAHRYQAATFLGARTTTLSQEYQQTFTPNQISNNQRAFSVVASPTAPPDFGTMPVAVRLIPADTDRIILGITHHVRVCLPLPADLADADAPRIAWRDGPVWRTLPSARSGNQICADFRIRHLSIVTTLTDDANTPGSLPYLLNQANATSTPTTIIFDPTLSGGTITPTSLLPLASDIWLFAQDTAGRSVDITLNGSQLPVVLRISSPTATVRGFDIVNFAGVGIAVAASPTCPLTARVTLSDNVLVASSTATSTPRAIELDSGPGCAAVTIRENAISQTPGSRRATGVYLHKTLSNTATSNVDLIVADNTITTSASGVYLRTSLSNTARSTLATTLSANRITGAGTGIDITSTTSAGTRSQVAATLSRNYITRAGFGIQMRLDGSGGSNTVTVSGSWNTVIGSSTLDLYASEYGVNGSQAGRSGFDVSGRLEHTLFNIRNIIPGEAHNALTRQAYRAAQRQRPPVAWALYHWPASFTAHKHQPATLSEAGTGLTSDVEYFSALSPGHADARPFSVVASPTPPLDFGTLPVFANILFRNAAGNVVPLDPSQAVRVCLPLLGDLADAPAPRIVGRAGTTWRVLSSEHSGGQLCANIFGFPAFTEVPPRPETPPQVETPPGNPGGGGGGGGGAALPPPQPLVGFLENPEPGSSQSGINLISGWTCARGAITLEVDGTHILEAAAGTGRADTAEACGNDGNNGFGLLFNWNLIGDGEHTIRALADGVEFDRAIFTVTTLGEEFIRGASGETFVADFPSPGEQVRLVWQEGSQSFRLAPLSAAVAVSPPTGQNGVLENPAGGSFQSGISVISGWVCEAGRVELEINAIHRLAAASGTGRADTAEACGNDGNNGFGLLFNWNLIGDGEHTIRALADGVEFSRATFIVTTLGEEFVRGASGQAVVADFPRAGETVTLDWQQSSQNFVITNLE